MKSLGDKERNYGVDASANFKIIQPLTVTMTGTFNQGKNALRFVECIADDGRLCSLRSERRDYHFANLDSSFLSFTLRGTWALSPHLSVQGYGQIFAARGYYHDYKDILGVSGSRPYLRRDNLTLNPDAEKNDGFSFATLNVNLVTRWEFSPGATVIFVYTRAQHAAHDFLAGQEPQLKFAQVGSSPTTEIVIVKLSLFYN